jgi:hypothetical protein
MYLENNLQFEIDEVYHCSCVYIYMYLTSYNNCFSVIHTGSKANLKLPARN